MKWKPEKGYPYCTIMTAGNIGYFVWEDSEIDNYLWSVGKIYKTEKLHFWKTAAGRRLPPKEWRN